MSVKIANKMFDRICGYHLYVEYVNDISEFKGIEISPCEPNSSGVLPPLRWFVFRNTKDELFVINVSRTPDGAYVFGYELMYGSCGGGSLCFPSMRWKHNNPRADTLKKCLVNAMKYIINYKFCFGIIDKSVREAAEQALRIIERPEVYQMTIFDILEQ